MTNVTRVQFGQNFLAQFSKRFPQSSAVLVDEILNEFFVPREAPGLMEFLMSLTTTESGLPKDFG